jgi:hypothetical protein
VNDFVATTTFFLTVVAERVWRDAAHALTLGTPSATVLRTTRMALRSGCSP